MITRYFEKFRVLLSANLNPSTPEGRSQLRYKRAALTSVVLVASRITNILTGLLTVPMTLKYLGEDLFGIWMVVTSIVGFLSFYDFGIGIGLRNTLIECLGKDDTETPRKLIGNALFVLALLAFIMSLMVAFILPLLPWSTLIKCKNPASVPHILPTVQAVLAMFALGLPVGQLQNIANAYQRGYWGYICFLVGRILGFLFVIWCIFTKQPLWLLAGAYVGIPFFVTILGWIVFLFVVPALRPWPLKIEKALLQRLFGIGFFVLVQHVSYAMINTSTIILIANTINAASSTPYSVTQKLLGVSSVFTASIILSLSVAVGEAWHRQEFVWIRKTLLRSEFISVLFGLVPLTIFIFVGQPIILWWTKSPDAVPSLPLLFICILITGTSLIGGIYSTCLMAMNHVRLIAVTNFLGGVVVFLGGYFVGILTGSTFFITLIQFFVGLLIPSLIFRKRIMGLLKQYPSQASSRPS